MSQSPLRFTSGVDRLLAQAKEPSPRLAANDAGTLAVLDHTLRAQSLRIPPEWQMGADQSDEPVRGDNRVANRLSGPISVSDPVAVCLSGVALLLRNV